MGASDLSAPGFSSATRTVVRRDVIAKHLIDCAALRTAVQVQSSRAWPGLGGCDA
jgi:hypothetical protein